MLAQAKKIIKKVLPRPIYLLTTRYAKHLLPDLMNALTGREDKLQPPGRMIFTGGDADNFERLGREFLGHFQSLAGLKPQDKVLDIGSGIGRMAIRLTEYLDARGSLEGFDIVPMGVQWCQQNITPRFPNFRFSQADIYNKEYNPKGTLKAAEFRFPYPDESFDFAFATSVFTHMFKDDTNHYLRETARTLKRGGKCLLTFFIINEETRALIKAGKSSMAFEHKLDGVFTTDLKIPEQAIAFAEEDLKAMFADAGLEILLPIRYGAWCGRANALSGQDIILAVKT